MGFRSRTDPSFAKDRSSSLPFPQGAPFEVAGILNVTREEWETYARDGWQREADQEGSRVRALLGLDEVP